MCGLPPDQIRYQFNDKNTQRNIIWRLCECGLMFQSPSRTGEELDEAGLRNHLDSVLEAGVHGIVLCAGTGEFAYLREEEKSRILKIGISHVDRRVPVVAQTPAINTVDVIENANRA